MVPAAVEAGIIASRRGSASVAPAPRNIVRRDMCFFVMNVMAVFSCLAGCPLLLGAAG
jgi:hypothetical protein